jgi:hypothetical protein
MPIAYTPRELFRAGSASSANCDRLKPSEILIGKVGTEDWVFALTGGISLRSRAVGLSGPWHRLPQGTAYDDALLVFTNDYGIHWLCQAARNMPPKA